MKKEQLRNLRTLALIGYSAVFLSRSTPAQPKTLPVVFPDGIVAQMVEASKRNPDIYQLLTLNLDGSGNLVRDYDKAETCPHDKDYTRGYDKDVYTKDYNQYDKCKEPHNKSLETVGANSNDRDEEIDGMVNVRISKFKANKEA